ncbi:hypothetical protein KKH13_05205 [Patescibacteria group bacterium]|nr:hypothetical protein [Patescibacteria group bacterium]
MYSVKILNDNDFDKISKSDVRYSHVDESNMGFADRVKGVAYVRYSAWPELNRFLVNHELEELESDESVHEDEYGIRHKKFFKELFLPLLKTIGLGLLGDSGAFGSAIGSGIGTLLSKPSGSPTTTSIPVSERPTGITPTIKSSGVMSSFMTSPSSTAASSRIPGYLEGSQGNASGLGNANISMGNMSPEYKERLSGFVGQLTPQRIAFQ